MLPSGAATPAPDGAAAFQAATARCHALKTYSAELHVSGRVAGKKLNATVLAGLTASDEIRLEMPAPFGRPVFVLAGAGNDATLLTRDDHVLTAPADRIIEALIGLPLGPRALLALLAGCGGQDDRVVESVRYETVIAVRTSDARLYLREVPSGVRVVAASVGTLIVEYSATRGWPTSVRVASAPGRVPAIDLSLSVDQIEADAPIAASAFRLAIPPTAARITLDDLRAAGPLGEKRQ